MQKFLALILNMTAATVIYVGYILIFVGIIIPILLFVIFYLIATATATGQIGK